MVNMYFKKMVLEPVPGVNGRMLRQEASGLIQWELVEPTSITAHNRGDLWR